MADYLDQKLTERHPIVECIQENLRLMSLKAPYWIKLNGSIMFLAIKVFNLHCVHSCIRLMEMKLIGHILRFPENHIPSSWLFIAWIKPYAIRYSLVQAMYHISVGATNSSHFYRLNVISFYRLNVSPCGFNKESSVFTRKNGAYSYHFCVPLWGNKIHIFINLKLDLTLLMSAANLLIYSSERVYITAHFLWSLDSMTCLLK